jgi:NAD(P)-dependent dehydrogenase (short-subunit alcohol dehydrogenase family)
MIAALVARRLICAAWSRRWQISQAIVGVDPHGLLPAVYDGEELGTVQMERDAYDQIWRDGVGQRPRDLAIVAQRWAVVVGARQGLGRSFVRLLADQGFSLLIVDENKDELDEVREATQQRLERGWPRGVWRKTSEMPQVRTVGCELSHVDTAVAKCEAALADLPRGSLKLLVHSLGAEGLAPALFSLHTAADVQRVVHTHLLLGMQLARVLWPKLIEGCQAPRRRAGVLFASDTCLAPATFGAPQAATHAALNAFVLALRAEAAELNLAIDVLALTPGRAISARLPTWLGGGECARGAAPPDGVARTALLLLTTASAATMTPLLSSAVTDCLCVLIASLLPEHTLSRERRLFDRHVLQVRRPRMPGTMWEGRAS